MTNRSLDDDRLGNENTPILQRERLCQRVVVIAGYVYYTKVHRSMSGDRTPATKPDNRASRVGSIEPRWF